MRTPYIGFGNDTLSKLPKVKKGDLVECPHCNEKHPLKCGTTDGVENDTMMFFKCGKENYLGAVDGRLVTKTKSDCSGEVDL